jgi:hypothetical protein
MSALEWFRRWGTGRGSAAISFSMVEELFGPSRHEARVVQEAQRLAAEPVPAPGDPPDLPASREFVRVEGPPLHRREDSS